MAAPRLVERIPDLLIEAGLIFLAVVLALGAEEWREKRDRQDLVERAIQAVTEEIRSNGAELEHAGALNAEKMESARAALAALDAGDERAPIDVGLEVSLLTSAAWESARMSQSVQDMELDLVRRLAELYDLQDVYDRMQLGMVERIGDIVSLAREDRRASILQGITRFRILIALGGELDALYATTLDEIEVRSSRP